MKANGGIMDTRTIRQQKEETQLTLHLRVFLKPPEEFLNALWQIISHVCIHIQCFDFSVCCGVAGSWGYKVCDVTHCWHHYDCSVYVRDIFGGCNACKQQLSHTGHYSMPIVHSRNDGACCNQSVGTCRHLIFLFIIAVKRQDVRICRSLCN